MFHGGADSYPRSGADADVPAEPRARTDMHCFFEYAIVIYRGRGVHDARRTELDERTDDGVREDDATSGEIRVGTHDGGLMDDGDQLRAQRLELSMHT